MKIIWSLQLGMLISLLCLTVLALGGNSDWVRGILTSAIGAQFAIVFVLARILNPRWQPMMQLPWKIVWALVTVLFAVQFFTNFLGLPTSAGPLVETGKLQQSITSVYPASVMSGWAVFSAYWMVAWMVSKMDSQAIKVLTVLIVWLVIFQAGYGLTAYLAGQETILGVWKKEHYIGFATGTFINRNHFSGFLALTWPILLSLLLWTRRSGRVRSGRTGSGDKNYYVNIRFVWAGLISLLIGLAILLSQSRLGLASAMFGLLVWSVAWNINQHGDNEVGKASKWFGVIVVIVVALAGIWFGVESLTERFVNLPESRGRWQAWVSLMDLPFMVWVTGIGVGTFEDVFRTVQSADLAVMFSYAHNDYLEFVLDFGLIGSGLILITAIYWLRSVWPQRLTGARLLTLSRTSEMPASSKTGVWFSILQAISIDSSCGSTMPIAWFTSGSSVPMRNMTKLMYKLFNCRRKIMDIKAIKTDSDYRAALKEVENLMMAGPDTPEGEKLDVMVTLIEAHEAKHFPMELPDPVEAIKFEMERKGLTVKDLEPMIGKSNRVYEILNHKRSLTLKMIWKLHEGLGIPAESLIKPPQAHT